MTPTVFVARRKWLAEEDSRLGARAFSGGGLEARERFRSEVRFRARPLAEIADVFRGPLHKRVYVREPSHGVRYLTASDVALLDPRRDVLLSTVRTEVLPSLLVQGGESLISSAGTIGSATFVRKDIAGSAVSQDMIRVIARRSVVPRGYLFAFLATAVARSMIRLRTYGSVVDRIEPRHLADLPVPLSDEAEQARIHRLIESSAAARGEAVRLLDDVGGYFDSLASAMSLDHDHSRVIGVVRRKALSGRLDAFRHVGWAAEPGDVPGDRIDSLANVIATARVPRVYTEGGLPFLSGIDVFRVRVTPRVRVARWVADQYDARVRGGDLAIQGSGQRYGLLGRVAYIGERLDGWAVSHDLFRIRTVDADIRARIFAFLRSDLGHRVMLRHSYGTSIPHVNPGGIAAIHVPQLPPDLASAARRALELREQADRDEQRAIEEVEAWLA